MIRLAWIKQQIFEDMKITTDNLSKLVNSPRVEDFNDLKDFVIKGNKHETNKLLTSTVIDQDKAVYYLSLISQRFYKLMDILKIKKGGNFTEAVDMIKPPVFWKDKQNFLIQGRKWGLKKINKALEETYSLEKKIKSDSTLDKNLMIKKLIVDLCNLANS